MITEQEIIKKLQSLKQVKPKEQWVIFARSHILNHQEQPIARINYISNLKNLLQFTFSKKFAYSLAVLLFSVMGVYGFMSIYPVSHSISLVAAEAELKNNFELMAVKEQKLAEAIEKDSEKIDQVVEETKIAVENVTELIKKEPSLAEMVAKETVKNRTYFNVAGREDLTQAYDSRYKTTLESLFDYYLFDNYKNVAISEQQHAALTLIGESYQKGEISAVVGVELTLQVLNSTSGE